MIKTQKIDNNIERLILIGLITSKEYLSNFIPIYTDSEFLQNKWAQQIAQWCIDYYNQYTKAPSKDIQSIFEKRRLRMDEIVSNLIAQFLKSISKEYERNESFNPNYILDRTVDYFKIRSFQLLHDDLECALQNNSLEEAEEIISKFQIVERTLDNSFEPYNTPEKIKSFFEHRPKPLLEFPGDLGNMINPLLREGSFVALMAPEKTGKSWWLDEIVLRGALQKCNTCLFDAGDMTINQRMERYIKYCSRRPVREYEARGFISYPMRDCVDNQSNECNKVERVQKNSIKSTNYKPCTNCSECVNALFIVNKKYPLLTEKESLEYAEKFHKRFSGNHFRLSVHSNMTLTFDAIERQLDVWERADGFIPNIIAIDYIDIMETESYFREFRHSQDYLWRRARKLSQERNVLLVVGTQANQKSYFQGGKKSEEDLEKPEGIKRQHVSEDKRKLAHATGIIGISQTSQEKENCTIRLNVVLFREGNYNEKYCVRVAQCLGIGRPFLFSF